ncbi:MAG: bifunctional diaminohydroxyphosphoribosylaminopyrimidine deaminase/5-amino-6-(5-phosphoribosylamino)uracil reductase RibD, partial [Pseudonocardiaceae bacterium]
AEVVAIGAAGPTAAGATLYVTLEPCSHYGRTPPCVDAVVAAGIRRVVVGVQDPHHLVAGRGIAALRAAGLIVDVGIRATEVAKQLAPYLKHRSTGRPWVVLKLAATLDGRIAAPDGSSRWITGRAARADVARLRSESDAVIVGAGTVRTDDPALTVRGALYAAHSDCGPSDGAGHVEVAGGAVEGGTGRQPLRVVLGQAPADARIQPALEFTGPLEELLDNLGAKDVVQVLVEGGATVAGAFHRAGLVDRYIFYFAPALLGGDDGRPMMAGIGVPTMADAWQGQIVSVNQLGADLRVEMAPPSPGELPCSRE